MAIESTMALQECMQFVGVTPDDFGLREFHPGITVRSGGVGSGTITVWLQNQPHHGPKLLADTTIYGFGIRFLNFEPEYQTFEFTELKGTGILTVTNNRAPKYSFALRFSR